VAAVRKSRLTELLRAVLAEEIVIVSVFDQALGIPRVRGKLHPYA
jgi:hypothetical protein